jgi:hypothetical protein
VISRIIREKCISLGLEFRKHLQRAVSMNKRRFIDPENHLDLDLTYICDRLIAMAIPCVEGALYRNDIREVCAVLKLCSWLTEEESHVPQYMNVR